MLKFDILTKVILNLKEALFVCLFELMLNIPVNSYGHAEMLSPFYGTFTQN